MLFASLVDDPSSRPDLYPTEAAQDAERRRLHGLIEGLCRWERSGDTALLAEAQRCIAGSSEGDPPRIIDPFCGGGAISTEAIRLGLDTVAIDLNPVAALVSAATVSIAQRFAGRPAVGAGGLARGDGLAGIAADIALYGAAVEAECRRRLAGIFEPPPSPLSPDGPHRGDLPPVDADDSVCESEMSSHHAAALHVVAVEETDEPMACASRARG